MTLIQSISGIRGTIGGYPGDNLTPVDAVRFAAAYARWLKERHRDTGKPTVLTGRDARPSGEMLNRLVSATLNAMGINVLDAGLSTTPSVEMGVLFHHTQGGIILTASHNPVAWNALKLLNEQGEFVDADEGAKILHYATEGKFHFETIDKLGSYQTVEGLIDRHIQAVLELPLVNLPAIRDKKFRVVVDGVNSTGGIAIPALLRALGVEVIELYCEPNGQFPHNPEPLPEHLTALSEKVIETGADFGIVVDPDVDRLAFVCEDGSLFGEEYTLVACADYVLSHTPGNTCSNLSSTRALKDITGKYGGNYSAAAVGEVNVVAEMKRTGAVIGGEGNGGVIYPALHYGRDALAGTALFLSLLAERNLTAKELRSLYPSYHISKNKISIPPSIPVEELLSKVQEHYRHAETDTTDGLKIDLPEGWIHLRKSNTEPIIRIYSESTNRQEAGKLASAAMQIIRSYLK